MKRLELATRAESFFSHHAPPLWRLLRGGLSRYYARPSARRSVFERIHSANHWGDADSLSGGGSNLAETSAIRAALPDLFDRYEINSLLDIPCGDFHWMRHVAPSLKRYIGADIVPALVTQVRQHNQGENLDFRVLDIVSDQLPRVDAVLARDVFIHLPQRDVLAALSNIKRSGSTWLITTTFPEHGNRDIITGDWRPINLTMPPYNLKQPVELIAESTREPEFSDRSLAMWRVADLP